ncbi:MAG: dTDP-4-dehydrorhamnose reductase [Hyphomicrobium sp.]
MRLLITGSHGQVARAFLDVAPAASDIEACAIGRPGLDICNSPTIERALSDIKPDVVINTAAYTSVDDAEVEAERAMALNRDGAAMLAAAAAKRGTPIIHLSTDYVFDGAKATPYIEDDPTAPQSVYGHTKLEGERAVAEANPQHIILRTAWVYSPFGKNFVKTILTHAGKGTDLKVVNDQIGSPTYAPHLVEAILGVARKLSAPGGTDAKPWGVYHAAGGGEASWYEVARAILESSAKLGGPVTSLSAIGTDGYPTRAKRPHNSRLDCTKLQRAFGIVQPDWHEGVSVCVARVLNPDA